MGDKCTAAQRQRGVGGCGRGRGNDDNNTGNNDSSGGNSNIDSSDDSSSASASTSNDNSAANTQDAAQQLAPPRVQTPVYHKNHGNNLAVEDSYYAANAHTERKKQNKKNTRKNRNRYGDYVVDKNDKTQKYKNRLDDHQGLTPDAAAKRKRKRKKKRRQHDQLVDRPQDFGGDGKRKADYNRYWSNGGKEDTMDEYRRKFGRGKRTTMLQHGADERARIRKEDDELEAIYDREDERAGSGKKPSKKQLRQKDADDRRKKEILDGREKAVKTQKAANQMVKRLLGGFDAFIKEKTQKAFDEAFNDQMLGDVGIKLQKQIDDKDKTAGLAISAPAQTKPEDYSQEWKDKEKEKKEKKKKKQEKKKTAAATTTTNP